MAAARYPDKNFADVARFFGRELVTIRDWSARGMPKKDGGHYDLAAILKWLLNDGPWNNRDKTSITVDDTMMAGSGNSPSLERFRAARADREELELAKDRRQVISIDAARNKLNQISDIIRRRGEWLFKQFGHEAALEFNNAISDCDHFIDDEFGPRQPAK